MKVFCESLQQLSQVSSEVVPDGSQRLQNATPLVRVTVAERLETFDHISPDVLKELLNNPPQHSHVRTFKVPFCVQQWYWLPDEVEALLLYKLDGFLQPQVRWEAFKALRQLDELSDCAGVNALLVSLHDEDPHVRAQVIETLNAFEMSSEVLMHS